MRVFFLDCFKLSRMKHKIVRAKVFQQIWRFVVVGVIATAIHYGIYLLLLKYINETIAYSIGYAISFICNFVLTCLFTFEKKPNIRRGAGFGLAHVVNYILHVLLLNFFIWVDVDANMAPLPTFLIVIPLNFILLRYVFKK